MPVVTQEVHFLPFKKRTGSRRRRRRGDVEESEKGKQEEGGDVFWRSSRGNSNERESEQVNGGGQERLHPPPPRLTCHHLGRPYLIGSRGREGRNPGHGETGTHARLAPRRSINNSYHRTCNKQYLQRGRYYRTMTAVKKI